MHCARSPGNGKVKTATGLISRSGASSRARQAEKGGLVIFGRAATRENTRISAKTRAPSPRCERCVLQRLPRASKTKSSRAPPEEHARERFRSPQIHQVSGAGAFGGKATRKLVHRCKYASGDKPTRAVGARQHLPRRTGVRETLRRAKLWLPRKNVRLCSGRASMSWPGPGAPLFRGSWASAVPEAARAPAPAPPLRGATGEASKFLRKRNGAAFFDRQHWQFAKLCSIYSSS